LEYFHAFPNIPIAKASLSTVREIAIRRLKLSDNSGFRNILSDKTAPALDRS
jgi:hypothetical protein